VDLRLTSFLISFANHQATSIGADGRDIDSVTMRLKTDEAVEEAFSAIDQLRCRPDIDNEPDTRCSKYAIFVNAIPQAVAT